MAKIINWGILGCGKIARKFVSDLKLVKDAKLYAVASRNNQNAESFANEFNAIAHYDNYEDLVADKNLDVIYIATPHNLHFENTILCLQHQKAVLCEKPFAMNLKQVEEMIRTAKEKKVFLMEAMWSKFLPHFNKTLEIINTRKLGELSSILVNFGFKPQEPVAQRIFDPALGGGTMMDIGIYNVFLVLSILGKPDEIIAHMDPSSSGVDEQCAVLFRYKNGKMAQLFSTFRSNLPTEADIAGSEGTLKLTNRFYEPSATIRFFKNTIKESEEIPVERSEGFGYHYEAAHVTKCIQDGLTESPVMTFKDSELLIETLDKIRSIAGIHYPADSE